MIRAVLFDLDGTLADTAPDLGYALNRQLEQHGRSPLPHELIRPQASHGARGLLRLGFDIGPEDARYDSMRAEYLDLYAQSLCRHTRLFSGMESVMAELEEHGLPWGIVTNKPTRFTLPLIAELGIAHRVACVVCADTCARAKPYPDPLFKAAEQLGIAPGDIVYVGDDERDMQAGLAAGMRVIVALYGYLGDGNHPDSWQAHAMIDQPRDLLQYFDSAVW